MSQFPTGVRVAQAVGLTGAAYLAGNISAYTFAAIPSLQTSLTSYSAPSTLIAKQWREMYNAGKAQNPPIAILTATAFGYLAYAAHSGKSAALDVLAPSNAVWLYTAAAAFTMGFVPWTFAAMVGTNKRLMERAEGVSAEKNWDGEDVLELLGEWKFLNGIRAVLPFVGGVLGFLAI
ncbi:DUF1772 domain-containing protein [Aspergillus undulatus]|uniref:DUF1772 domain-containing protein n=1 Tax=Aspergillus undulatus TaxID=1810928 RepID=UPI003CCDAECB